MANISIVFDPPVNKDNLHNLPPYKKREIINFLKYIYARPPTDDEIFNFLETLNLKDKERETKIADAERKAKDGF